MKTQGANKLFTSVRVGSMELEHRVVMAPLTRSRSVQPGAIPGDLMLEYYTQRASEGGLIVSEATPISIAGGGWFGAPGLYSNEQVAGWRRITNAVHGKRGYMFSPLWHTGRASPRDATAQVLMASSFPRVTATSRISFCKMASTSEPICMVVQSRIAPVSCF